MNTKQLFIIGYILAGALALWSIVAQNWEFVLYAIVAVALVGALHRADAVIHFVPWTVAAFNGWLLMHILGGLLPVGDSVLYSWVVVPLIGAPYDILKYDQIVHTVCYFVVALLLWQASARVFRAQAPFGVRALIVVIAAVGVGGLNEIVEFIAVVTVPDTNVGGYTNTLLDLIANTVGAVAAVPVFRVLGRERDTV